jgi:hypothetical protein
MDAEKQNRETDIETNTYRQAERRRERDLLNTFSYFAPLTLT